MMREVKGRSPRVDHRKLEREKRKRQREEDLKQEPFRQELDEMIGAFNRMFAATTRGEEQGAAGGLASEEQGLQQARYESSPGAGAVCSPPAAADPEALFRAAEQGHLERGQQLWRQGGTDTTCNQGRMDVVRWLVAEGEASIAKRNGDGASALVVAAAGGMQVMMARAGRMREQLPGWRAQRQAALQAAESPTARRCALFSGRVLGGQRGRAVGQQPGSV